MAVAGLVDIRAEATALRRVSLLLDRLSEDGYDVEVRTLTSGVNALRRAAADGSGVNEAALRELAQAVRTRLASLPSGSRSARDLLLSNAVVETDELLRRLEMSYDYV